MLSGFRLRGVRPSYDANQLASVWLAQRRTFPRLEPCISRVPIFSYLAHAFPIEDNFPKPFYFIFDEFRFLRRRLLSEDRGVDLSGKLI